MKWQDAPLDAVIALVAKGVPKHTAAGRLKINRVAFHRWLAKGKENLRACAEDPEVDLDEYGLFATELRAAELAADEKAYRCVVKAAAKDPVWAWRWLDRRRSSDDAVRKRGQRPFGDVVDAATPRRSYDEVRGDVLGVLLGKGPGT